MNIEMTTEWLTTKLYFCRHDFVVMKNDDNTTGIGEG